MVDGIGKACSADPTCPNEAGPRGPCLEVHAPAREAARNQRRQASRDVYLSRSWTIVRARVLERDAWTCRRARCFAEATDVDHVIPLEEYHGDPYDEANLESLCHRHHAEKSGREAHTRRR